MLDYIHTPKHIKNFNHNVVISMGVVSINRIGFSFFFLGVFYSLTSNLCYKEQNMLYNTVNSVIECYNANGFKVTTCIASVKFECLNPNLNSGVNRNITANK